MLQWGRNLTVADGPAGEFCGERIFTLQWGRNLTVADGAPPPLIGHELKLASMGPQLDSCGWPVAFISLSALSQLQWGRNLTVADGPVSKMARSKMAGSLQWGRNLTVADGVSTEQYLECPAKASMGPQLDSCGWPDPGCPGPHRQHASMGPQLDSCGWGAREMNV